MTGVPFSLSDIVLTVLILHCLFSYRQENELHHIILILPYAPPVTVAVTKSHNVYLKVHFYY